MARPSKKDPLDKFRWTVEIEGFTKAGFTVCGVPAISYNTKSYPEGGAHLHPKKIVDSVEYKPVVLSRGVTTDESFMMWARQILELHRGRSNDPTTNNDIATEEFNSDTLAGVIARAAALPPGSPLPNLPSVQESKNFKIPLEFRREVKINHVNRSGEIVKTYTLFGAFPTEFTPASDFQADGDDLLSMESITLVYEGFEVTTNKTDSNPFDVRDVSKRLIRGLF